MSNSSLPDKEKSGGSSQGDQGEARAVASLELGDHQRILQQQGTTTQRQLTARHAIFIAWGGTVGTGLFVTTGKALATGGPAFLVGSYVIISLLMYSILAAIVEMATFLPVRGGSMSRYGSRFVSPSLGVMMSCLYIYSFAILVPFELVACSIIVEFWGSPVPSAVWITILGLLLVVLNVLPVRWYGEAEFIFTGVKICTIFGLLILAVVLFFGGAPHQEGGMLLFRYWRDPAGAAAHTLILKGNTGRLIAAVATFVSCALPFTFTPEMIVGTAAEIQQPRKNVPRAARHFTLRLIICFVGSVIGISIVCPSNAEALTAGSDAGSSPWVVGIREAGIQGLDSVINAVVLVAAWSTGNAFLYLASRALHAMAVDGNAPSVFKRCTAKGVPIYAVGAVSLALPLAYLTVSSAALDVLYWLLNLVNTGGFLSWVCCGITYLRFRRACHVQGVPVSQLTQRSWIQPYASYVTIFVFGVLCFLNAFTVFFPGYWSLGDFISGYIGLPIFIGVYFLHRFVYARSESWMIPAHKVQIRASQEELDEDDDDALDEETASYSTSWDRLRSMARRHV